MVNHFAPCASRLDQFSFRFLYHDGLEGIPGPNYLFSITPRLGMLETGSHCAGGSPVAMTWTDCTIIGYYSTENFSVAVEILNTVIYCT